MFGGGVRMSEVSARFNARPNAAAGSLAAWLERESAQPPKPGQMLHREGIEFVVRRVRRGRVFEASASSKGHS